MAVAEPARTARRERFTVKERQYRYVVDAALVTLTLIIVTGAAVRLTGSGLGCHQWPRCNDGELLPALQSHTLIEFGNRMLTGVVGLPCLLAAIGAYRLRPFRRDLVVPAVILPLGVLAQAVIGGITVLLDLSWEVVIAHYLLSCALLVAATVLAWRIRRPAQAPPVLGNRLAILLTRALVVFGGYVIVAGTFATASGPHAGGAGTGDYVERLSGLTGNTLRSLIHLHGHSAAVMGFATIGLWLLARRRRWSGDLQRSLAAVGLLLGLQGVVGLVQYHAALPAGVVWVHASLAAVLWVALVWTWLTAGHPQAGRGGARGGARAAGSPS